jgi:hypothetical protein
MSWEESFLLERYCERIALSIYDRSAQPRNPSIETGILRLLAPVFTETGFYLALFGMPMVFLLRLMFAITTTGTLLA